MLLTMLVGSTALILALCLGLITWIMAISASRLDASRKESELLVLRSVVRSESSTLGRETADYSAWTELYDQMGQRGVDLDWENTNLGPYLTSTFALDGTVIISRAGQVRYVYGHGLSDVLLQRPGAVSSLRALARLAFVKEQADKEVTTSGFSSLAGAPTLVALATIRDSSLKRTSEFALINIRKLTPAYLGHLGTSFGLHGIALGRSGTSGMDLSDIADGPPSVHLSWRVEKPGRKLVSEVLPIATAITAAATIALLGIAILWTQLWRMIRQRESRLHKAELAATDARAAAAEETSRSKSALIANMSHELRTPLNAIIGFSELIAAELLGPIGVAKYREYIHDIQNSGRHLLNIVDAILNISRIDAGKYDPELLPICLGDVVSEAAVMLRVIAQQRRVSVDIGDACKSGLVLADYQGLLQILINLLSNAVKFSPEGGVVTISYLETADYFTVIVSDQGCGIPAELLPSLGQPFVQAEDVYRRTYQGTGLGLSICFKLAKSMSASLIIQSAEGEGTQVTLSLLKASGSSLAHLRVA